jgi:opacity protein-like surface antigen
MKRILGLAALLAASAVPASAAVVTHDANDIAVPNSPPFGAVVPGGVVGTAAIAFGVDYTFGNSEAIFDDGGGVDAFCGLNGSGVCTLQDAVDGRIVLLNSTTQGFTSSVSVEAGFAANGSLTLSVFGLANNLLATAVNGPPAGPNGRTTITINRALADIAYFRISGADSFGVNLVAIESPGAAVPEPATWAMMIGGFGLLGAAARRRSTKVVYA